MRIFLLTAVCPTTVLATATSGAACAPVSLTSPGLAAGNYYIFAGPNVFTGVPCSSNYTVEAIAAAPCPADIAPAGGDDVVDIDDLLFLIGQWGACP